MKKKTSSILSLVLLVAALWAWQGLGGDQPTETPTVAPPAAQTQTATPDRAEETLDKAGHYSSREEVALYLHQFGRLPENFITKREAEAQGWNNKAGNLYEVTGGKSIGGDHFGNYDGLLPDQKGRAWHECDIDYTGGHRGAKRLVYSSDGLIYYTEDHYKTFTQIY